MSKRERTGIVRPKKGPSKGKWLIQPAIEHPPFCVCGWCLKHRKADEWAETKVQILNRLSATPESRHGSLLHAARVKEETERALRAAVEEANVRKLAAPGRTTVKQICDAYRSHHLEDGKRLDRDRYRIDQIERFLGEARDAASVTSENVSAFMAYLKNERQCGDATIERYLNSFSAIYNSALTDKMITGENPVIGVRRKKQKKRDKPKRFSPLQVEVLLGHAIDELEARRREKMVSGAGTTRLAVSDMPIRGFCLIAYRTLMRPNNNFGLRWEDLIIDVKSGTGYFRLSKHKNSAHGVELEGPLAPSLLTYLIGIMPSGRRLGLIHPNPQTGKAYTNIRDQWYELIDVANTILPDTEQIQHRSFYQWRATGASELAAHGADPVMVAKFMGDTSLQTILRHYFDSSLAHMTRIVTGWDRTVVDVSTSVSASELM